MRNRIKTLAAFGLSTWIACTGNAQAQNSSAADDLLSEATFEGLTLRNIGPAVRSGRVADLAIHPEDESTWYVAVGSGGVWKTRERGHHLRAGLRPRGLLFHRRPGAGSRGHANTVWVGTGEHGGGRHFGFGDGIYKSTDGGKSWTNMGLGDSQHIGKIIVHPGQPGCRFTSQPRVPCGARAVIAAFSSRRTAARPGPRPSVTRSSPVSPISPSIPRNPAARLRRDLAAPAHRGRGDGRRPKSAIYRSEDGGDTWQKLAKGLPEGKMGKIGLAVSPAAAGHRLRRHRTQSP
jgi:hypothetical protein